MRSEELLVVNRRTFIKTAAVVGAAGSSMLLIDGCNTSWVTTIENDLPELIAIATSIASLASGLPPNMSVLITTSAQALQVALQALQSAVSAYNDAKSQGTLNAVIAALSSVQASVQKVISVLPAGTQYANIETAIVAGLGLIVTIISTVRSLIPGAVPSVATVTLGKREERTIVAPTADTIRLGYNSVLRVLRLDQHAIK